MSDLSTRSSARDSDMNGKGMVWAKMEWTLYLAADNKENQLKFYRFFSCAKKHVVS